MSAASFRARYAAYSIDMLLVSPLVALLAFSPLVRAWRAFDALLLATEDALFRAYDADHVALMALAEALRSDLEWHAALIAGIATIGDMLLMAFVLAFALFAAWFIGFEASRWQATPGKRVMGLRVETLAGGRAPLPRVALRFVAGAPSWLLLHLGHAFALWRADGRAAHDLVSGLRVVGDGRWPRIATAVMGFQVAVVLALLAWMVWNTLRAVLLMGL